MATRSTSATAPGSASCSRRPAAATRAPSAAWSSPTAASCTPTATGCSARSTTPRTRSRTRCCAPGAGWPRFEGRSSLRSWLYTIATNTCLNAIARRPKRVLPIDYGPAADPHGGPGEPLVESVWIEPYPDETLGRRGRLRRARGALRAARERRARVHRGAPAPAGQPARGADPARGARLLGQARSRSRSRRRSPRSTARCSARATTVDERLPEQSQQATLRSLGDEGLREVVDALRRRLGAGRRRRGRRDADRGRDVRDAAAADLVRRPRRDRRPSWPAGRCRARGAGVRVRTRANGQEALAFYSWDERAGALPAVRAQRADLRGDEDQRRHRVRHRARPGPRSRRRSRGWPEQPADPGRLAIVFESFGLPERLD